MILILDDDGKGMKNNGVLLFEISVFFKYNFHFGRRYNDLLNNYVSERDYLNPILCSVFYFISYCYQSVINSMP